MHDWNEIQEAKEGIDRIERGIERAKVYWTCLQVAGVGRMREIDIRIDNRERGKGLIVSGANEKDIGTV